MRPLLLAFICKFMLQVRLQFSARKIKSFIRSILKSLVILAIWLALNSAIYSQIAPFFALNRILSLAHQNGNEVTKIEY